VAKFKVALKKSALKQLRLLPKSTQELITSSISTHLVTAPYKADGKHIKKLIDGYRLRVGNYRIFYFLSDNEKNKPSYYLDGEDVIITSIVRRTSTTY